MQPILILPFHQIDEKVCPARTIQHYLQKTKELRKDLENLFLTFKRPFKNVSTQTISRWLKTFLRISDVDTTKFIAHSTRHASTSAAARK